MAGDREKDAEIRRLKPELRRVPACATAARSRFAPALVSNAVKAGKRGHPETFSERPIQTCLTRKGEGRSVDCFHP